eukprot:1838056-Rhodomonas_salina.1
MQEAMSDNFGGYDAVYGGMQPTMEAFVQLLSDMSILPNPVSYSQTGTVPMEYPAMRGHVSSQAMSGTDLGYAATRRERGTGP